MYPLQYAKYIHSYWLDELLMIILQKLHLDKFFPELFDKEQRNINFDKKVAEYLLRHRGEIDAVFGYEDTSRITFEVAKGLGIKCIYELPIGYWKAKESILDKQKELYPDWAITMSTTTESIEKLKRKDSELSLADAVIVPSQFVKETLKYYPREIPKIQILQYGAPVVSSVQHKTNKTEKLRLLFCGNLTQRKGLADVFEVYKKLDKKRFALTIIGNGKIDDCISLRENLKQVEHKKSVSHDELLHLMQQADIFLFPSHFEGFALVIFDSMSQGLPVMTTIVTSGPITNGYDGWIINPNDIDGMVLLLNYLEHNRDEIQKCSMNAKLTASKYSWDSYQQSLCHYLKTIL